MGCICPKGKETGSDGADDDYVEFGKYIGERNCIGQKSGRGQYYYDNGDSYDGMWKRNKKHGYGKYTFSNGRVLEGFFENDKYLGDLAPTEENEDDDEPLDPNPAQSNMEEPLVRTIGKEEREARRKERQKKVEEMRKKYGVRNT